MDNTVGSLTEEQKSIIVGKVLGDGTLRRNRINTLLEVNHSWKQKDYVFWLYNKLENVVLTAPRIRISGENRKSYRFTTRSLSELNHLHTNFYQRSRKVVPKGIYLDSLVLAIWFMDDGSKSRNTIYLNTQQFGYSEQLLLIGKLNNIGIQATVNKDKSYFRIRIRTESMSRFLSIVNPNIIDSMKYKLPL